LLVPFHEACKPRSAFRVGTEAEKFGVLAESGEPLPFEGPRSVQAVLTHLAERHGWTPEREHEQGQVISLLRNNASVTLEPAGQLELSGAPYASIHDTCKEFRGHLSELQEISKELGIVWLSLGFHPFASQAELPHVPKLRYGIMERYLPTRGARALDMMRRTCTVQANMDYENEADAMRKLRVALALQPIVTAIFANSPFYEGRRGARLSERADVWLNMDPDRSGLLPFAWDREATFQTYVEWALDVPMFMIKRGAKAFGNTEQTFRMFLKDGAHGEHATLTDWKMHLNTLFPEVRLKNTLEMRGADAQPTDLLCALPALWKGVIDDTISLERAEQLASSLDLRSLQQARSQIAHKGLAAELGGKPVQRWAADLLEIAEAGLQRFGIKNADGQDESIHLARIKKLVAAGKTPAEQVLSKIDGSADFRQQVIAAARV
jgi:glutamate--cysteine ligase